MRYSTIINQLKELKERTIPPFSIENPLVTNPYYIQDILKKNIPELDKTTKWMGLDGIYYLPSLEEMKQIINWDWTNIKRYIPNSRDCENYAIIFKGRVDFIFKINNVALVIDYGGGHGYNLFITKDGNLYLFEPQNDKIWNITEHNFSIPYPLKDAFILI